jgi:hypothetical protein
VLTVEIVILAALGFLPAATHPTSGSRSAWRSRPQFKPRSFARSKATPTTQLLRPGIFAR